MSAKSVTKRDGKGNEYVSSSSSLPTSTLDAVEKRATKLVVSHLPHADPEDAEMVAASVLAQYLDGDSSFEIIEMLSDMLLHAVDGVADDDTEEAQAAAEGIVDAMAEPSGCFALATAASGGGGPALYSTGDRCLAVLEEDGEWHGAEVVQDAGRDKVSLRFVEYRGLVRGVLRDNVMHDPDYGDGDDGDLDDGDGEYEGKIGSCQTCERVLKLTRHHLIPQSEHRRIEKQGVRSQAWLRGGGNILMCCRQCHSFVHKLETNKTLADVYNTAELINAHPGIVRWVGYISKVPPSNKWLD